jgi:RNA polymerase sigma factor (sigma-70 family)
MNNYQLIDDLVVHRDELVDFISGRFGDRQFAQEVVQETCLRVLQKHFPLAEIDCPIAMLYTISLRVAIDFYRKEKNGKARVEFCEEPQQFLRCDDNPLTAIELSIAKQQREQILYAAIQQLPDSCRDVFILTQLYHYTQQQVAEQLKLSRGMVARYLAKALQMMLPFILVETDED